MRRTGWGGSWPLGAMVAVLIVAVVSFVVAGPEQETVAETWPHQVLLPDAGPPAIDRLVEIHDRAVAALPAALPAERPDIVRVLKAVLTCASFDGVVPVGDPPPTPLPAHAPGHAGAAERVRAAFDALNMPPDPQHPAPWADWARCAEELEHGHEE